MWNLINPWALRKQSHPRPYLPVCSPSSPQASPHNRSWLPAPFPSSFLGVHMLRMFFLLPAEHAMSISCSWSIPVGTEPCPSIIPTTYKHFEHSAYRVGHWMAFFFFQTFMAIWDISQHTETNFFRKTLLCTFLPKHKNRCLSPTCLSCSRHGVIFPHRCH